MDPATRHPGMKDTVRPQAQAAGEHPPRMAPVHPSGVPLWKKIGYKPGQRVAWVGAPPSYVTELGPLPAGIQHVQDTADLVHAFCPNAAAAEDAFRAWKDHLATGGMLWVSWPKRASGVQSDLSEDIVRDIGIQAGLIDVKVCRVDDTWSGLKFVRRRTR